MIMKQPPFRYNSKTTLIISVLQTLQPPLTPVYRRRENCHRLVDIFIHSVVHSFSYPIRPGFSTDSYSPRRFAVRSLVTP
jgi:hypothetical protein